jgi:hypothetical protein
MLHDANSCRCLGAAGRAGSAALKLTVGAPVLFARAVCLRACVCCCRELRSISGASLQLNAYPDVPACVKKGEEVSEAASNAVLLFAHPAGSVPGALSVVLPVCTPSGISPGVRKVSLCMHPKKDGLHMS